MKLPIGWQLPSPDLLGLDLHSRYWGFGLRNGRVVPLILDGNSRVRIECDDESYGLWPSRKFIATFWTVEVHPQAAADIENREPRLLAYKLEAVSSSFTGSQFRPAVESLPLTFHYNLIYWHFGWSSRWDSMVQSDLLF